MMNRFFGIILLLINFTLLQAATITVTNLNDTGVGSLRDALTSPATVNGDIIRFNPALIAGGSDTLRIYSTINVNKSLVVKGMYNNTDTLYISGQDSTRIFQINPGAANNFQLDSMVLVRGRGGVLRSFSANTLLLSNCIVSHNSTTGQGGSMYVGAIGLLHIQNSIFYKNQSTGQGGAIYLSGNGLIEESTFYDNTANGQGAGIYSSGLVEVDGSTFYRNNSNGAQGGAIYNTYGLTIRRSTICYNLGSAQGGSVYNTFGMEIYNSTIAYNSGGVFCNSGVGSLTLGNCVIGFDTAQQSMHYNATFNSLGYNVISPTQPNINLASSNNTDSLDFDEQYLKLLPLGNYGGPTLTMMPNASSYLVERGNPGDNTMAQNIPIVNIREIGAAEYINVVGNDTISSCDSVLYNGVWYYQDTVITTLFPFGSSSGIDSVHVVNIEVSSSIAITNPTITSCSPVSINGTTYYVDTTIVYTIPSNGTSNCDTIATQSIIVDTVPTTISQNGDTLFAPLGYTYQWLNCTTNSLFSGETNSSFTPSASGDYAVIVSSPSCTDTSNCYNFTLSDPCLYNRDTTYTYLSSCNPADTGVASVLDTNQLGCDSIHYTVSTLLPIGFDTMTVTGCDSALALGSWIYTSSSFNDTIAGGAANGCDSITTYNVTVYSSDSTFASASSCNPSDTGVTSVTNLNINGCDSVHTITTSLLATSYDTIDIVDCDSTLVQGSWISTSSSFNDTISGGAANGCDYITTFNVTINYSDSTFATASSCNPGDTGTVSTSFLNVHGCDSVHTLTTTLIPTSYATASITACDSAFVATTWIFSSDTFNDTISGGAINGCDSIVTFQVIINNSSATFATASSCNPVDTGVFIVTTPNVNGCDSVHTITTSLLATSFDTITLVECDSAFANGSWIYTSGFYTDTIAGGAANGCDSITTFDVSINSSDSTFASIGSCNPLDTGSVSQSYINLNGCDSVHTITTSLLPLNFGIENITACDAVFVAGSWYFTSSIVEDTIVAGGSNGCDSITTFNITIHYSDSTFATAVSCFPEDTGFISENYSNQFGCDSIHTIQTSLLTPVAITNPVSDTTVCSFYGDYLIDLSNYNTTTFEWEDGSSSSSLLVNNTGSYLVALEDSNSCVQYDTINVQFYDCLENCYLICPSGFSPNGDGTNDMFKPIKICDYDIIEYELSIYNRFGERIFASTDINTSWDGARQGKAVGVGVYTYYLQYAFEGALESQELRGNLTIIR